MSGKLKCVCCGVRDRMPGSMWNLLIPMGARFCCSECARGPRGHRIAAVAGDIPPPGWTPLSRGVCRNAALGPTAAAGCGGLLELRVLALR